MKWVKISGYNGVYQISNLGGVKSFSHDKGGKLMRPSINSKGYLIVQLSNGGISKNFYVHRLVANHFLKNSGGQVNHMDHDKENNDVSNLEWVSSRENRNHFYQKNGDKNNRGVFKQGKKYRARMEIGDKLISLGSYDTEEEASFVYKSALRELDQGKYS